MCHGRALALKGQNRKAESRLWSPPQQGFHSAAYLNQREGLHVVFRTDAAEMGVGRRAFGCI
jgi:hypothetical protein